MRFKKSMKRRFRRFRGRGGLAKKVANLTKKVNKRADDPRHVYFPTTNILNVATALTNTVPHVRCLNTVTIGDTELLRQGDKCKFQNLDLSLKLKRVDGAARGPEYVRVLIVKEKTTLGSDLSLSQYFNSATPSVIDRRNIDTRDSARFTTYYDKLHILGGNVQSTGSTLHINNTVPSQKVINIFKKLNFTTDYSRGTAGTVADIDTNGLFLIMITDSVVASDITADLCYKMKFY